MKKVLIGSPVRQKSEILKCFIKGLDGLDISDLEVRYFFIDDNTDEKSTQILNKLKEKHRNVEVKKSKDFVIEKDEVYTCNSLTHLWKKELIEKIIKFKNEIINYAINNKYDYVFFIDSDIVVSKNTLKHLMSRDVDIVSNIFWSQWIVGGNFEPQVWLQDAGSCFINDWDNPLTNCQKKQAKKNFISLMKIPGIYEVGGLGACTLIKTKVLAEGVNFNLVNNISFWGEDRHFCIRASARDIKMYVDTVYPVYHIYREEYVNRVDEYLKDGFKFDMCQTYKGISLKNKIKLKSDKFKRGLRKLKIILKDKFKQIAENVFQRKRNKLISDNNTLVLSMIVHNEEKRFLEEMLEKTKKYVDKILIIDDASTDKTVELCEKVLKDFPHRIVKNEKSLFSKEYKLRQLQWKETLKEKPGWILSLDADEIFEEKIEDVIQYMLKDKNVDAYRFRLYDMWNDNYYRSDDLWNAHKRYGVFLVRVFSNYRYKFKHTKQHCGRFPKNIGKFNYIDSPIRLKHYGWSRKEDREIKYERYKKLDPKGKCGNLKQYESILDESPNLIEF